MKRTPDGVSKARQKLRQEIEVWRRAIRAVKSGLPDAAKKTAFGEAQIKQCEKALRVLRRKAVQPFWKDAHGTSVRIRRLND